MDLTSVCRVDLRKSYIRVCQCVCWGGGGGAGVVVFAVYYTKKVSKCVFACDLSLIVLK